MIQSTPYGELRVAPVEQLFRETAIAMNATARAAPSEAIVALTGGSTPKAFYAWAVREQALVDALRQEVMWTVSDERHVPLDHADSNFGTAQRLFLEPLGISPLDGWPWPVAQPAGDAAASYAAAWQARRDEAASVYDLCLLGLGDDCHTASIFPGSPLLEGAGEEAEALFAAVEVPGKGWRLTVTPAGLARCGRVVITVTGAGKAAALRAIMQEPYDPRQRPAQVLRTLADRVTWLVDPAAASLL